MHDSRFDGPKRSLKTAINYRSCLYEPIVTGIAYIHNPNRFALILCSRFCIGKIMCKCAAYGAIIEIEVGPSPKSTDERRALRTVD